ncbi:MAG TPA: LuxR C-terminal-related transcriptional regulator [Actinocatenispora sp.]
MAESAGSPLLGRAAALAVLRAGLDAPGPAYVEVVGDPGMGKSRLLAEFGRLAADGGHRVVTGTGARSSGDHRPGLFVPLLRELGDPAPTAPRLVERLSGPRRYVLLLDDAHLADPDSLELLGQLCYEAPPVLLVVAYRGRQLPPLLAAALRLIRPDGWHHRLDMDPLGEADLAGLLGIRPGPRLRRLAAVSAGNPQYARALAAVDPGLVHEAHPELLELAEMPAVLVRELRAELARLPADERALLTAAAVVGDEVVPSLAIAVTGLDAAEASAALDALIRRDLLRDGRSGLAFRHPVVRAAAYRDTPPGTRRALHGHLAAELRARGATESVLARHLARCAEPGDVAAAELLAGSVRDAAPRLAADRLAAARALLPPDHGGLRFELDVRLAEVWAAAGQPAPAREMLRAPAPADAPAPWRYRQMRVSARVDRLRGLHRQALGLVGAELDRVPEETGREITALAVEAAICAAFCGAPEAPRFLARARRAVAGVPDASLHALVAALACFVGIRYGGEPSLRAEVAAAGAALDALRDTELADVLDATPLLGWAELMFERDADALRHFDRGLAVATRSGRADTLPYLFLGRCSAASRLGLLEPAMDAAQECADAASALGNRPMLGFALTFQAVVLCWLRGPVAAGPVAAEAAEAVADAPHGDWFALVGQRVAARLRHSADDVTDPTVAMVRACGGPELAEVELYNRTYWCSVLVEMSVRAGNLAEAAHWLDRGEAHAAGLGLTGSEAYLALSRARYELAAGRPKLAEGPATRAVRGFADVGWIVDEVHARLFAAALRAELSGWSAAEPELVEARRLAERTGGAWLRRLVVAEQRRLAGAAGRGTPSSRLTRREAEIARLVAAGATNTEIGAHLHVTVKTVEAHLTRMFRKLGVRSRAALVATLADETA